MQRKILEFTTTINQGKSNESHPVVQAYQCRNGLAAGHPVRQDSDGNFKYSQGWRIYHINTGALVSGLSYKGEKLNTPAQAMRAANRGAGHRLVSRVREAEKRNPTPAQKVKNQPRIIGKLQAWPKPKPAGKLPGCEHIAKDKNHALLSLIAEIDAQLLQAPEKSALFRVFTFGRTMFKINARREALQRFRANVLKNRRAFADSALPKAQAAPVLKPQKEQFIMQSIEAANSPAIDRALAVLRASIGNVQTIAPQTHAAPVETAPMLKPAPHAAKAVAHSKPPRKVQAKAAQPAHDIWFYFGQQKSRAERRTA
jgi:hypothetical protein